MEQKDFQVVISNYTAVLDGQTAAALLAPADRATLDYIFSKTPAAAPHKT